MTEAALKLVPEFLLKATRPLYLLDGDVHHPDTEDRQAGKQLRQKAGSSPWDPLPACCLPLPETLGDPQDTKQTLATQ